MNPLMNRVFSSFLATSVMTLFGYIYSFVSGNNLKEPELLGKLIRGAIPKRTRAVTKFDGWFVHYAVGLLFTEMYHKFWQEGPEKNKLKSGLVFGAMGGLAAILIWRFAVDVHPNPPSINFSRYAMNLFIGHLLFGIISAFTIGGCEDELPNSTRVLGRACG
jgi:hypothetical protein